MTMTTGGPMNPGAAMEQMLADPHRVPSYLFLLGALLSPFDIVGIACYSAAPPLLVGLHLQWAGALFPALLMFAIWSMAAALWPTSSSAR